MASNESTCSNKGTLKKTAIEDVTSQPEPTNLGSDIDLGINTQLDKSLTLAPASAANVTSVNADQNEECKRNRTLTEKGEKEQVRRLKQNRTNALAAITRKQTDIKRLMADRNNLDVVRTELNQFDVLCQHFCDAHNLYFDTLITPEERDRQSLHFDNKDNDNFEYRKSVVNWILECEARISNQLPEDRSSVTKRSHRSRSSHTSRSSSVHSARLKEKAKIAELMAERAMLNEKLRLKAAEEQLQIELKIAKAKARETAFAEMDGSLKGRAGDDEYRLLPISLQGHEQPLAPQTPSSVTKPHVKTETKDHPDLNPNAREFFLPPEIKTEEISGNFKPQRVPMSVLTWDERKVLCMSCEQRSALTVSLPDYFTSTLNARYTLSSLLSLTPSVSKDGGCMWSD